MYIYIYLYILTYIYIYLYIYLYIIYVHTCIYTHMYIMHVYMYIYTYIYMFVSYKATYIYIYNYSYISVYPCICKYIYIYSVLPSPSHSSAAWVQRDAQAHTSFAAHCLVKRLEWGSRRRAGNHGETLFMGHPKICCGFPSDWAQILEIVHLEKVVTSDDSWTFQGWVLYMATMKQLKGLDKNRRARQVTCHHFMYRLLRTIHECVPINSMRTLHVCRAITVHMHTDCIHWFSSLSQKKSLPTMLFQTGINACGLQFSCIGTWALNPGPKVTRVTQGWLKRYDPCNNQWVLGDFGGWWLEEGCQKQTGAKGMGRSTLGPWRVVEPSEGCQVACHSTDPHHHLTLSSLAMITKCARKAI